MLSLDLGLLCEGKDYYYLVFTFVIYILLMFLGCRNCKKGKKKLRLISVFLRSFKALFVQFNFHFFPHFNKCISFPLKKIHESSPLSAIDLPYSSTTMYSEVVQEIVIIHKSHFDQKDQSIYTRSLPKERFSSLIIYSDPPFFWTSSFVVLNRSSEFSVFPIEAWLL